MEQISKNFKEEVLDCEKLVLVDFSSPYCGPCKYLEPTLKKISEKLTDVKFVKVSVEDMMEQFTEYKVSAVPTMVLFKDGKELERKVGNLGEEALIEWIKSKC